MTQLSTEGRATEHAVYRRSRRSLRNANDEFDLAIPLQDLTATPCICAKLSVDANILLERILEKTQDLWRDIQASSGTRH